MRVFEPKSEDIIYIREIFPGTTPMAPGGLPWDGEPSESAALVMPSVVAAGQRLSLPVDVALTLQRVSVLEVCRAGGSDNGATPSRRAKAGGRTWWKGCRAPPPAWSRPVTTALWGSLVCQGRSAANPPRPASRRPWAWAGVRAAPPGRRPVWPARGTPHRRLRQAARPIRRQHDPRRGHHRPERPGLGALSRRRLYQPSRLFV